jgi:hypothetical protein
MYCKIPTKTYIFVSRFQQHLKTTAMNKIKLLILFVLVSLQVGATGYSNNMFVAQRMLNAKKSVSQADPVANANGTVARITSFHKQSSFDIANQQVSEGVSVIQCVSEWMIQVFGVETPKASDRPELQRSANTNFSVKKKISSYLSSATHQAVTSLKRFLSSKAN